MLSHLPVPLALLVECCRVQGLCWGLGLSAVFIPFNMMSMSSSTGNELSSDVDQEKIDVWFA